MNQSSFLDMVETQLKASSATSEQLAETAACLFRKLFLELTLDDEAVRVALDVCFVVTRSKGQIISEEKVDGILNAIALVRSSSDERLKPLYLVETADHLRPAQFSLLRPACQI